LDLGFAFALGLGLAFGLGAASAAALGAASGAGAGAAGGGAGGSLRGVSRARDPDPIEARFVEVCLQDRGFQTVGWK